MITEYHRPTTLDDALKLLSQPNTRPLGGGTVLTQYKDESFAVVDLQALGLDKIHKVGDKLEIGATVTLSLLLESAYIPPALAEALRLETPLNLRNMGTVAGTLVTCTGRSTFSTAMLALDAKLTINGQSSTLQSLGDFLSLRKNRLP
jgi:aerobic carbon-monoxide dehydrogenase medium subunit